jgi:hypothetical protein
VIVCYGLLPFIGAVIRRYNWYDFRRRFDKLRFCPLLDYGNYWLRTGGGGEDAALAEAGVFRFSGGFESVTDGRTLWIRSEDITVPVSLQNAESYRLPVWKNEDPPDDYDPGEIPPEIIRWEKISALTEGAKVFVGGSLKYLNGCRTFVSTKENPLIVIFYDCPDPALVPQMIQSGRQRNEYWNTVTPYALVIGALGLILTALLFRSRPAYSLTVMVSVTALFIPLYPIIPPGLLFTGIYRRLSRMSRVLRACGDLARLGASDNLQVPTTSEQNSGGRFTVKAYLLETAAWVFLLAGIALNIFFLRMVLILLGVLI